MKVVGLGNALVDILALLKSDECIAETGLMKGGMQLIDEDKLLKLNNLFKDFDTTMASGGSAANAISGLSCMGIPCGMIGKIGCDSYGSFYRHDMENSGVAVHLLEGNLPSGCAMTLITPDGERTFGTYLGASATLTAEELHRSMFEGYDLLHIEGYLVQDPALIRRAVELAKEAGLRISLDLASYNVVRENYDFFHELIPNYIDIVFANEEESLAYTGKIPEESVREIGRQCEVAVVKCGSHGSLVVRGDEYVEVEAVPANVIDTTGAGDLYAAGCLYGLLNGYSLSVAGEIGSELSGRVIEITGTKMSEATWAEIKLKVSEIIAGTVVG